MKLIFEDGDFGSKKCKRGYGGAYDRVYRILRFTGVWSLKSEVKRSIFCWWVWQKSGFDYSEYVFTFNLI
jgi:hypothetical protein